MDTQTKQNEIVVLIKGTGLSTESATFLQEQFLPFYEKANEWKEKAESLVVTDVSMVKEMKDAREARIALKDIRVSVEKKRKEMKAESLRTGQAIDGVANILKGLIEPIEDHLEKQEKFAEIKEKERIAALQVERAEMIKPFVDDVTFTSLTGLGAMPQSQFDALFNGYKLALENKIAAEKKAEEERIAAAKKLAEEQEAIRLENERLKKEADERERILSAEREKAESVKREFEAKERAAKEKADAEAKKLRDEAEAKLRIEREEKERLEKELRAKEVAEQKRISDELTAKAKAEKEKIAAEKKSQRAPDKSKLVAFSDSLTQLETPSFKSEEARLIYEEALKRIRSVQTYIINQANSL